MNEMHSELATDPVPAAPCPTNGRFGQPVGKQTIKSLLARSLTLISPTQAYRFCPAPDCATVYYRADGQQVFGEDDLRERVYQKHIESDEVLICFCFQHSVGQIRAEIEQTGTTTVVDYIMAGISAGQCACDVRNPQGNCCLGQVRGLVQHLMMSASSGDNQPK